MPRKRGQGLYGRSKDGPRDSLLAFNEAFCIPAVICVYKGASPLSQPHVAMGSMES